MATATVEPKAQGSVTPDESDKRGEVLAAALSGKPPVEDKPEVKADEPKPETKVEATPDPDREKQVEENLRKSHKTLDQAIQSLVKVKRDDGKKAQVIDAKDKQIDSLNAQIAALSVRLDQAIQPGHPKPGSSTDDDGGEDSALDRLIEERAQRIVEKALGPLKDNASRQEAEKYTSSMKTKWGDSWDGLGTVRVKMVDRMKSGEMLEPEIWQLAAIGQAYIDQQLGVTEGEPTNGDSPGPLDERGSTRSPKVEKPGDESSEDLLSRELRGLPRIPMGVSRVR